MIFLFIVMYFSICIASVLKFFEREKINKWTFVISLFTPILLMILSVILPYNFFTNHIKCKNIFKKIYIMILLAFATMRMTPMIHSMLILIISSMNLKLELSNKKFFNTFKYGRAARSSKLVFNGELNRVLTARAY